ncbi:ABC transporter ATP-binding protein [Kineosporia sp. J2-2]|uniref:ABC transporter ATP-binding protein n=1 Tax=Kineosporia corallincola TaxID=2835133 RepID=A0ABS5TB84_9ACTN|nr:ABC transporter ATP-binding protein [Kineosporia corallincola]MBT0768335.1 ABC transporter ATP-binding protein [Kineosporia corallincola]
MTTTVLRAQELSVAYDGNPVITGLDLSITRGQITTLVGANGSGKSTLLKTLGRILKPAAGQVFLDDEPITALATKDVARRLAVLPQTPTAPAGITVRDLVMRGRNPHQTWARPWSAHDARIVTEALTATGLDQVADRDVAALSGGQRQRVWIALVVAQQAPTLLLDEPTTYLDLTHQLSVLSLVRRINTDTGATVVMVLHDLSLAARYSDRLVVMHAGTVVADGPPADVLTPATLLQAFDLHARVVPDPVTGTPLVVPESH